MQATERLWRTGEGKLVRDGDEGATELAYTPGDEIASKDESLVPGTDEGDEKADRKAAEEPTNKQAPTEANKAAQKPADK